MREDPSRPIILMTAAGSTALLLLLASVLLAVESTGVYASFGSYAVAYHQTLQYVNKTLSPTFWREFLALVYSGLALVFVDAGIVSFLVTARIEDFGLADGKYGDLAGLTGLIHCAYSIFMTFVFSSPLEPSTNLGQLAQVAFTLQGLFLITVAFAGLLTGARFARGA
ncbi:hypothetical protein D0Z06_25025 [Geodermatophilus marinus]|nr:hypothetical protein D0Z06_25025 [Geodermatophilus sp. LHW52908]